MGKGTSAASECDLSSDHTIRSALWLEQPGAGQSSCGPVLGLVTKSEEEALLRWQRWQWCKHTGKIVPISEWAGEGRGGLGRNSAMESTGQGSSLSEVLGQCFLFWEIPGATRFSLVLKVEGHEDHRA